MLGKIIARIKFDDGSHLSIVDDSDLVEFIHHHAWFEGDEVALSREDRVYLFGNFHRSNFKETSSNTIQFWSSVLQCGKLPFLWRQSNMSLSQKKLARMLWTDDVAGGDEDGGYDTASTWKPLTANQKRVVQNIHNNCGHPSREEFLRALRLSRARSEVLNFVRREFECGACAAKRTPSEAKDACSITTDIPF